MRGWKENVNAHPRASHSRAWSPTAAHFSTRTSILKAPCRASHLSAPKRCANSHRVSSSSLEASASRPKSMLLDAIGVDAVAGMAVYSGLLRHLSTSSRRNFVPRQPVTAPPQEMPPRATPDHRVLLVADGAKYSERAAQTQRSSWRMNQSEERRCILPEHTTDAVSY